RLLLSPAVIRHSGGGGGRARPGPGGGRGGGYYGAGPSGRGGGGRGLGGGGGGRGRPPGAPPGGAPRAAGDQPRGGGELRPAGARLSVAGIDVARHPDKVRRVIGLAGQYAAVEPTMTGRENLRMVARLFGLSRRQAAAGTDELLSRLGLDDVADRLVKTYS